MRVFHAIPAMNQSLTTALTIEERFRGPPTSGNGGYVAGVFASALTCGEHCLPNGRAVEVTLRAPTPLDRSLQLQRAGTGTESLTVFHETTLVAEAAIKTLLMDVPAPPAWEETLRAREHSYSLPMGFHPMFNEVRRGAHPICFCCGAELSDTEGLQVYAAPLNENRLVAAAWIPNPAFADSTGFLRPEMIWTALDCPGQMAWLAEGTRTGMLGRLTARIEKSVRAGERCIVTAWTMGSEGRKYFAGTALFNEAGELCAYAKAVWIGRASAI
jgi:hypothetical protein